MKYYCSSINGDKYKDIEWAVISAVSGFSKLDIELWFENIVEIFEINDDEELIKRINIKVKIDDDDSLEKWEIINGRNSIRK
jgi:hypothetical protein